MCYNAFGVILMNSGEKIRLYRKARGLSQKQLASKTGIAEITIRQYEAGRYEPKLEKLRKLASALDVTIADLNPDCSKMSLNATATALKHDLPADELDILQDYRSLNNAGKTEARKRVADLTFNPHYRKKNDNC